MLLTSIPEPIFAMFLAAVPVAVYALLEVLPVRRGIVPTLVVMFAAIAGISGWSLGLPTEQATALFFAVSSAPAVHGVVQKSGVLVKELRDDESE